MFRRTSTLGTALTLVHAFLVVSCVSGNLGVARAVRDLPQRNPPDLRALAIAGDVLAFPASLMRFWWDDAPDLPLGLMVSPLWGFGLAFVLLRRRTAHRP